MKNLKKALALIIASVAAFGTVASADISFVNPNTIDMELRDTDPTAGTTSNSYTGDVNITANGHDLSKDDNGVLTFTTKSSITDFNNGGAMTEYFLGMPNDYNGSNKNTERRASFGKTKVVLEYSLHKTSNENCTITSYNQTRQINPCAVIYKDASGTEQWKRCGTDISSQQFWGNNQYRGQYKFAGASSGSTYSNMQQKQRMTVEVDPEAGTIVSTIVNVEDSGWDGITNTWTVPEGGEILYVVPGARMNFNAATEAKIYSYTITRETVETENAAIDATTDTLTATVDAYSNVDTGSGVGSSIAATIILAQYDANGRMINCTTDTDTLAVAAQNATAARSTRAAKTTLTASLPKDANYSYAKMFVWDGTDTLNPFVEVFSNEV